MPSRHLRTIAWTVAVITIIAAGLTYGTDWAPSAFTAAATSTACAAGLELTTRIDDDT
ncbi:hypothetical protein [Corynebacterium kalidii]